MMPECWLWLPWTEVELFATERLSSWARSRSIIYLMFSWKLNEAPSLLQQSPVNSKTWRLIEESQSSFLEGEHNP